MTKLIGTLVVCGTLVSLPAMAYPQDDEGAYSVEPAPGATPEAAPPSELPPAPPSETPPAHQAQEQAPSSVPPGQWVHTQQYGWIWMPYSDGYTYYPPGGYGEPYAYVFYPAYGWSGWPHLGCGATDRGPSSAYPDRWGTRGTVTGIGAIRHIGTTRHTTTVTTGSDLRRYIRATPVMAA
jgi:hypothetical protein